jgi:hypothetical protein
MPRGVKSAVDDCRFPDTGLQLDNHRSPKGFFDQQTLEPLETENEELRRQAVDLALQIQSLRDVRRHNW